MTVIKKTIFISDLHLDQNQRHIADNFLTLLKYAVDQVEALYILGDFFEAWIGDDDLSPFSVEVIHALKKAAAQGLAIYIMRGNRDFLLGKRFAQKSHCTLLPDEVSTSLYGTRILLMHGDSLCTEDRSYQRARKIFRNPFIQFLFLSLPRYWRNRIAGRLRQKSKSYTQNTNLQKMDAVPATILKKINGHKAQVLIHGHTHRPAIHKLECRKIRIVLGAWGKKGNMLIFNENSQVKLVDFDKESILQYFSPPQHDSV